MRNRPDHGENSYRGFDRLAGKAALITGGDRGIGRAAPITFAREGVDVVLSFLPEEERDLGGIERSSGRVLPGDGIRFSRAAYAISDADILFGMFCVSGAAHQQRGASQSTKPQTRESDPPHVGVRPELGAASFGTGIEDSMGTMIAW